jgi:thiamine thiazole synthase
MAPPVASPAIPKVDSPLLFEHKRTKQAEFNQGTIDVNEDYEGNYKFAPIEEAQVSRAMIKRYVI